MKQYKNRMVIKIEGTSFIGKQKNGSVFFEELVSILADIQNMGYELILIPSGALTAGMDTLSMKTRPENIRQKQMAAVVGQCSMLDLYDSFFNDYNKVITQILLNAENIKKKKKKKNLSDTINTLLEMGISPIVNTNSIAGCIEPRTKELLFEDDDMLAVVIAALCKTHKLIVLSDEFFPYKKIFQNINIRELSFTAKTSSGKKYQSLKNEKQEFRKKMSALKAAESCGVETTILNIGNLLSLYEVIKN